MIQTGNRIEIKIISEQVEKERREKQAETLKQTLAKEEKTLPIFEEEKKEVCDNKLTQTKHPERVSSKIAETFNTNRTYISEATKLKENK